MVGVPAAFTAAEPGVLAAGHERRTALFTAAAIRHQEARVLLVIGG